MKIHRFTFPRVLSFPQRRALPCCIGRVGNRHQLNEIVITKSGSTAFSPAGRGGEGARPVQSTIKRSVRARRGRVKRDAKWSDWCNRTLPLLACGKGRTILLLRLPSSFARICLAGQRFSYLRPRRYCGRVCLTRGDVELNEGKLSDVYAVVLLGPRERERERGCHPVGNIKILSPCLFANLCRARYPPRSRRGCEGPESSRSLHLQSSHSTCSNVITYPAFRILLSLHPRLSFPLRAAAS